MNLRMPVLVLLGILICYSPAVSAAEGASLSSARALYKQGDYNTALAQLQHWIASHANDYQAWFLQGTIQARMQQHEQAISSFQQVIRLQPALSEPHYNLAVIYNDRGDYHAAVRELERSLALNPDNAATQESIGDLYIKLAAAAYKQSLAHTNNPSLQQRYHRLLHIKSPAAQRSQESQATQIAKTQPASPPDNTIVSTPITPATSVESSDTENNINAVLSALQVWRKAWSKRDMQAYFAAYSDEFDVGPRFSSLQEWQQYKRRVISKRSTIRVTVEQVIASEIAGGAIRVVFLQHFRSNSYNSDNEKELIFKKTQGKWKIVHEVSI